MGKRKKTPAPLRVKVWETYIGLDVGQIDCPMCEAVKIYQINFHCSHVVADIEGGECSLENLRPLCSICNQSMGKQNMLDYAKMNFPNSSLIPKPQLNDCALTIVSPDSLVIGSYCPNANMMCLNSDDNLVDILIRQVGLESALTYVTNCGLGFLAGDCRLLHRVYLPSGKRPAIMFLNKSKTQFVYYDEKNERVEINLAGLGKKLASILQRSYLKAISSHSRAMPQLEECDLESWSDHINDLNNEESQEGILKSINLLSESEVKTLYNQ
jgi:hypothetical protein